MQIEKDGILLNPKMTQTTEPEYAPDDLVEKISTQIEEKYAEALRLLAKEPNDKE